MNRIKASSLSKRFLYDWVIDDFSYEFVSGKSYGLMGPNGSGKSTLLQLLSGKMLPSGGNVAMFINQAEIEPYSFYRFLSYSAPYVDLINEFTLKELINFHFHFKGIHQDVQFKDVLGIMGLAAHKNKVFAQFSSGMKQRCKLALALLSESPVIFIDEPGTNLDSEAKSWYHDLVHQYGKSKLMIIATNEAEDISFCNEIINIKAFQH